MCRERLQPPQHIHKGLGEALEMLRLRIGRVDARLEPVVGKNGEGEAPVVGTLVDQPHSGHAALAIRLLAQRKLEQELAVERQQGRLDGIGEDRMVFEEHFESEPELDELDRRTGVVALGLDRGLRRRLRGVGCRLHGRILLIDRPPARLSLIGKIGEIAARPVGPR